MALVSSTRTTDTAAEPLLSFDLTTRPDPLKASPENPSVPEEKGELIIVGARRHRDPVDVEWIRVKVPAGTMAPDLAGNLTSATARISLDGWTPHVDESSDEFVFTPAADHETIGPDIGFTIQLSQIPINRKVGTAPITVTERSRTGQSAFQDRPTAFDVGKFPADFYLRNLIANPLVINNGGEITLTWERSTNATYELLHGATSLNVTNETTRTITNVTSDTTFYLRGTTGDPTNPVVRVLTVQVTVLKPDLHVRNLTVSGAIAAHGDVTISPGTLTVSGPADLMGRQIPLHAGLLSGLGEGKYFVAETSGIVIVFVDPRFSRSATGMVQVGSISQSSVVEEWVDFSIATLVTPMKKGLNFSVHCGRSSWEGDVRWSIYWMPFGSGTCTEIYPEDVEPELKEMSEKFLQDFSVASGDSGTQDDRTRGS
ncbi:hypothetical protein ABZ442_24985 [Streptomyces triculaminicus]|uniref:hypothetical protein n=1 Tax=Streptomyces triculaminicus TaxID=2816232 RepID=UPI0033D34200